jgi:hypothetical protein
MRKNREIRPFAPHRREMEKLIDAATESSSNRRVSQRVTLASVRPSQQNVIITDKWRAFCGDSWRYAVPMTRVLRAASTTSSAITDRPLI